MEEAASTTQPYKPGISFFLGFKELDAVLPPRRRTEIRLSNCEANTRSFIEELKKRGFPEDQIIETPGVGFMIDTDGTYLAVEKNNSHMHLKYGDTILASYYFKICSTLTHLATFTSTKFSQHPLTDKQKEQYACNIIAKEYSFTELLTSGFYAANPAEYRALCAAQLAKFQTNPAPVESLRNDLKARGYDGAHLEEVVVETLPVLEALIQKQKTVLEDAMRLNAQPIGQSAIPASSAVVSHRSPTFWSATNTGHKVGLTLGALGLFTGLSASFTELSSFSTVTLGAVIKSLGFKFVLGSTLAGMTVPIALLAATAILLTVAGLTLFLASRCGAQNRPNLVVN